MCTAPLTLVLPSMGHIMYESDPVKGLYEIKKRVSLFVVWKQCRSSLLAVSGIAIFT